MKLNIANPAIGAQKTVDIDDEKKLRAFYDQRMAAEVAGDEVGEEFKGYVFRITGGNDAQGFPMMQGVISQDRVRLLLQKGQKGYRQRKRGERKRKSVRGCIVGPDIAILNLVIVKQGEQPIPGLTDEASAQPMRLGPKRASKLRKLFNLTKEDDVCKYVIRRTFQKGDKKITKAPKIQRLVTPLVLQRKRRRMAAKKAARAKSLNDAAAYQRLLAKRLKE